MRCRKSDSFERLGRSRAFPSRFHVRFHLAMEQAVVAQIHKREFILSLFDSFLFHRASLLYLFYIILRSLSFSIFFFLAPARNHDRPETPFQPKTNLVLVSCSVCWKRSVTQTRRERVKLFSTHPPPPPFPSCGSKLASFQRSPPHVATYIQNFLGFPTIPPKVFSRHKNIFTSFV